MSEQVKNLDLIDIQRLIRILGREKKLIIGISALFLTLAAIYLMLTPTLYTSKAIIYLDKSVTQTVNEIASIRQMGFENASIESEIEVFKSDRILDKTIANLVEKGYFKDLSDEEKIGLRSNLTNKLRVSRIGETYILEIQYTDGNPELASEAANALAEAFIQDQLDNLSDMSIRTVDWLRTKLEELSLQILQANHELKEYRARYNRDKLRQGKSEEPLTLEGHNRLEKEIEAYEQLYDAYLEKLKNIGIQDSFPVTETRIIKRASSPKDKSHPRSNLILAMSVVFGFGLGCFIALVKDILDSTLKRAGQIKREINTNLIGFMPPFIHRPKGKSAEHSVIFENINNPDTFTAEEIEVFRHIQNTVDFTPTGAAYTLGIVTPMDPSLSAQFTERFSRFCAISMPSAIIDGYTTFAPGENQYRSTWFTGAEGFEENKHPLAEYNSFLITDPKALSAQLIPLYNKKNVHGALELAKQQSEFVIVNCPPLLKKSDLENYLEMLDGIIIVLEWGKIKSNELKFMIEDTGIPNSKLIGCVLMNVDLKKLSKHYGHKTLDA